ncbi:hypothetical protein EDC01DRAFT_652968 [Geopyxis carbonaria]|nr:hypothetical protein EDC01DRAFT_652968 [Geopyxis carbonaria]
MADNPMPASADPTKTLPELEVESCSSSSSEDNGSAPGSPVLTRTHSTASTSSMSQDSEEWEIFPPLDKLTIFDFLDQLALPERLEKVNRTVLVQRDNLKKQRDRVKKQYQEQKEKIMKRTDIEKYRQKYSGSVDRILDKWNDTRVVSVKEKISFVVGVSNVFITGFLIGGYPDWVHIWYSLQMVYFMPIRYWTYHKRGYHYFLADLCYFVNLLLMLSVWVFPNSRRLMISTYCLAYGNNAWAIAMWRNSMVFHSLDKVTSLFIHIMPPVVLHCLVHLADPAFVEERFPAISRIKGVEHYGLREMIIWATVPYAVWQLSYHYLITVRRREKIAAGRPTSFTWLRKSYSKTWIGKLVLALPDILQEPAFMGIQYIYAVLTMLPCPFWFYHRGFSALFISAVGLWSIYNGATFYIDVFGKRFQKELDQLKKDMAKWQNSPDTPHGENPPSLKDSTSVDNIPQLDSQATSSGTQIPDGTYMKGRNATTGSLPLSS